MGEDKISTTTAVVTLVRLCIGPGLLALPYACAKGGLLFSPAGIIIIGIWNVVACSMMMKCKDSVKGMHFPNGITSTYSKIAFAGLGWIGVVVTDACVVVTLIGVCIAYQINFAVLIDDIPGMPLSTVSIITIGAIVVYPVCCAKSLGGLSGVSLVGFACTLVNIFALFAFGISYYWNDVSNSLKVLPMSPKSSSDLTSYFGVGIFCYGICSLAFPVEESMQHRRDFGKAVFWCVIVVAIIYNVFGDASAIFYVNDSRGINGNILLNLPQHSVCAILARVSMAAVCLLTYPLTFVPAAQMIEQGIIQNMSHSGGSHKHSYQAIPPPSGPSSGSIELRHGNKEERNGPRGSRMKALERGDGDQSMRGGEREGEDEAEPVDFVEASNTLRCVNRLWIVIFTSICAAYVPCFGLVVSLLGCFTISVLSFVLPPLLHLLLITRPALAQLHQDQERAPAHVAAALHVDDVERRTAVERWCTMLSPSRQYIVDVALLVIGVLTCVVGTAITFRQVSSQLASGAKCT